MTTFYDFNPGDPVLKYCNSCNTFNIHTYHSLNPATIGREGNLLFEPFHQVHCGNTKCDTTTKIDLPVKDLEEDLIAV